MHNLSLTPQERGRGAFSLPGFPRAARIWQRCGEIGTFHSLLIEMGMGQLPWNTFWLFKNLSKLNNPAISLLGIYLRKMIALSIEIFYMNVHVHIFIVLIVKNWQEAQGPSMVMNNDDGNGEIIWHIHNIEYYKAI